MQLVVVHAEAFVQHLVGFADQLHVAVFDAVVHHLHVVTGTAVANPVAAGSPSTLAKWLGRCL